MKIQSNIAMSALTILSSLCSASMGHHPQRNDLLENGVFLQIPGPNPLLLPGEDGTWDSEVIETADAIKDNGKYYLFYHGPGNDEKNYPGKRYQIGVALADHPLGPFRRYGDKPVLEAGPEGSWDSSHVACGMVLKEGLDQYYMWYSGHGGPGVGWFIGLATADNILGPWKKHSNNPIMEEFGYVGGAVKVNGKYYLYSEHPIGSTGDDYGPLSVATADKPEGPWVEWEHNPALLQGEWGEWDDGGLSEAEVIYHSGVFHMFYGGSKLFFPRMASRECIGYAYSFDGLHFKKYGRNPVVTRLASPNTASFSEVHAIVEMPFIYLYHTLRYIEPWQYGAVKRVPPRAEDVGVQVLVTQKPFSLDMPIIQLDSLDGSAVMTLNDTPPINLSHVSRFALSAQCRYDKIVGNGHVVLHVRASANGKEYDTEDLFTLSLGAKPGKLVRKTFDLRTAARYVKVIVANYDMKPVTDVKVVAILGG